MALGVAFAVFAGALLVPTSAWAVPAFARAYGARCSACHTAWPMLNATGRKFKENGYTFVRGEPKAMKNLGKLTDLPITFPAAAVVKFRPYDKKKDGDTKLRALHEVELFFAGNAWKYGSFFAELEWEDETDFTVELVHAVGGAHAPTPLLNLQLGKAPVLFSDPYDTLTNARKLTRSSRQALVQGEATGVKLSSNVQFVSLYGRETLYNKLFYLLTYSADVDDAEGAGPKDWTGRLAVDILNPHLSVGGFVTGGQQATTVGAVTRDLNYSRYGFDFQGQYEGLNLLGVFEQAKDDMFAGGNEKNNLWYVEAYYAVDEKVLDSIGIPGALVVPTIRFDGYQQSDGTDDFLDFTLNLSYYPWENVRVFTEYFTPLDVPTGTAKEWRWTVQVEIGF
jgi:hypothetical protein